MYIPFILFKKLNKIISYEDILNEYKKIELNGISRDDLVRIEEYFKIIKVDNVLLYEENRIFLNISLKEYDLILNNTKLKHILFNSDDRCLIIYLYIFIKKSFVSINHFKSLFGLSKNTILNDIKFLNTMLFEYNIVLEYDKKDGYFLNSDLISSRNFVKYIIDSFENNILNFIILKLLDEWNIKVNIKNRLNDIFNLHGVNFTRNNLENILNLFLLVSLSENIGEIKYTDRQINEIKKLNLSNISTELSICMFNKKIEYEEIYILSNLIVYVNFYEFSYENNKLKEITSNIIEYSKQKYAIKYKNINEFKFNFYMHLINSFYRILFDIKLKNNIIDEIKEEYKFLLNITKDLLKPLENYLDKEIDDTELSFFALHFGSEILNTNININHKKIKALITCPDGISSSLILKKQLEQLFAEVDFTHKSSYEINYDNIDNYDIIFSTNENLKSTKKNNIYYLNTILDSNEKSKLIEYMMTTFGICYNINVSVDDIMDNIIKDMNLNQKHLYKIREILIKSIYDSQNIKEINKKFSLKNVISFESILLDIDVEDINDAIYEAAESLVKNNIINIKYVENVLNKMRQFPNSCYLTKYFIMPHTFDNENVYNVGISFLRLKKELYLNNNKDFPIKFIIFLATNNNYDHLYAMNELLNILNDNNKKNILLNGNFSKILNLLY